MDISSQSRKCFGLICLYTVALMLVSCDQNITMVEQNNHKSWRDITHTGLPTLISMETNPPLIGSNVETLEILEDSSGDALSTGLNVFNETSPCSQLLAKNVEGNQSQVKLNKAAKAGDFCEYYVYPEKGQIIDTYSHSGDLKVSLISPTFHDFENGSYKVTQYDKHVIRVETPESQYLTNKLDEDVTISIK